MRCVRLNIYTRFQICCKKKKKIVTEFFIIQNVNDPHGHYIKILMRACIHHRSHQLFWSSPSPFLILRQHSFCHHRQEQVRRQHLYPGHAQRDQVSHPPWIPPPPAVHSKAKRSKTMPNYLQPKQMILHRNQNKLTDNIIFKWLSKTSSPDLICISQQQLGWRPHA